MTAENYTMRAGSQCIIYPLCTRLDPAWGKASEKFRPERWLNDDVTRSSKEFAPFGLGKRACLGIARIAHSYYIFYATDLLIYNCDMNFTVNPHIVVCVRVEDYGLAPNLRLKSQQWKHKHSNCI